MGQEAPLPLGRGGSHQDGKMYGFWLFESVEEAQKFLKKYRKYINKKKRKWCVSKLTVTGYKIRKIYLDHEKVWQPKF